MEQKIAALLREAVKPAELLDLIAGKFYEQLENNRETHRILLLMLNEYETFTDYFQAASEELTERDRELLADIQEDFIYQVETYFDEKEDEILKRLLAGQWARDIREDMKARGICPMQEELTEDEVETVYAGAFEEYDRLHFRFVEKLMSLSPKKAYEQGENAALEYRKKHRILFDEKDFIAAYHENFSRENLWKLLCERLEQTLKYGRHYVLCWDEEDDEAGEDEERDEEIGVLEGQGDLSADMFEYVYELMQEYTGRRILPSENQWGDQAYWTTYQDDFQELLGFYILDCLELTIHKLDEERPREYESLARSCGLSAEERTDPEAVLLHCDKVNYYLTQLNEELWNEFTETKVKDLLQKEV